MHDHVHGVYEDNKRKIDLKLVDLARMMIDEWVIKVLYRPEVNGFELLTSILSHKDIQLNYLANKMKPVDEEQHSENTKQKDLYARTTSIHSDRKSVSEQEKDKDELESGSNLSNTEEFKR